MIASLVQSWLNRVYQSLERADANPQAAQEQVYARLTKSHSAALTLQSSLALQSYANFAQYAQLTTYNDYAPLIEQAMHTHNQPGLFEPKLTGVFGHSSNANKFVPFTRAHIKTFKTFQMAVLAQAVVGRGFGDILKARTFVLQGNFDVHTSNTGAAMGYSSAVMLDQTPYVVRRRMSPSVETLRLPNMNQRLLAMEDALLQTQPQLLSGIPEFVVGALRHMLEGARSSEVRKALAHVRYYGWSGAVLGPYRQFFNEVLHKDCVFFDAVSATEAPMGIQAEQSGVYRFAWPYTLLHFVPANAPECLLSPSELARDQTYEVVISSAAGLTAYRMGDFVRIINTAPLRFELLPRSVNVTQECARLGSNVTDFCAYLNPQNQALTLWLESTHAANDEGVAALAQTLGARAHSVRTVAPGTLAKAMVQASSHGMVKLPKVHGRADLQALLERFA